MQVRALGALSFVALIFEVLTMRSPDQKPAAIEEEVSRGLLMWFAQGFNLKEGHNLFYAASANKAFAAQLQKQKAAGLPLSYPMAYLRLSDVTRVVTNTAYNPKSMARHGVMVRTDDKDREYVRKLHLIRTDFTYEVTFIVDDHQKALEFTSLWITLGQENRLNFTINYYGVAVDIACRISESMTIPERETSVSEEINAYEFQAQITVEGYVTAQHPDSDSDIALVRKISVRPDVVTSISDLTGNTRLLNAALTR